MGGYPDFEDDSFLRRHVEDTLGFYRRNAIDPEGGFFHAFLDDGRVYDHSLRHLVSSCRFVFNFAQSAANGGPATDMDLARCGFRFLEAAHRRPDGSYSWELRDRQIADPRGMAYGHAFALLAAATALKAGIGGAASTLDHVWEVLETAFWEPDVNGYCDEFADGLSGKSDYRGQNANMHICEAAISAWEATSEACFLDRAELLARRFAGELAGLCDGLVWEHYHADWTPDYEYNRAYPDDLFRPWGFQTGHQVEWARLLLTLDDIRPDPFYMCRAKALYRAGLEHGHDELNGGLYYGFAPDGTPCSVNKYYWVQSETIATAWRLYCRTGDEAYRDDYNALWRFAWDHFVDHDHGAWFRVLTREGKRVDNVKSPPGKTDYHVLNMCWDVQRTNTKAGVKRETV